MRQNKKKMCLFDKKKKKRNSSELNDSVSLIRLYRVTVTTQNDTRSQTEHKSVTLSFANECFSPKPICTNTQI